MQIELSVHQQNCCSTSGNVIMFVLEKDNSQTCPVCCLVYLVLPDASKAVLSGRESSERGRQERCSMSLGCKHYSRQDLWAFGNEQATVPWTGLTTFAPQSLSIGSGSLCRR